MSDDDLALGTLFPEIPRAPSPPPTFETYKTGRGQELSIRLISKHSLWAHRLWNASKVLVQYLDENSALYVDKSVCELGAGGALPSIVCALQGAALVVSTDYPEDKIIDNITFNAKSAGLGPEKMVALGYRWGQAADIALKANNGKTFDLLILSDLVFNHSQHAQLLKSCDGLLSPDGTCLVFYTHHVPKWADRDLKFNEMAKASGWNVQRVVETQMEPMFKDDDGDLDMRRTVHGFSMSRQSTLGS